MKFFLLAGITVLSIGLVSFPVVAGPEDFIRQSDPEFQPEIPATEGLPPDVRRHIEKIAAKRKSAYRRCQVHARACGLKCVEKFKSDKKRQSLCFKENSCQSDWDNCVDQIQNEYPLDLSKWTFNPG